MQVIYTLNQLQERLGYWQKLLRLQDWEVTVQFQHYLSMSEREAQVTWSFGAKKAIIDISTEDSYASDINPEQDMENGLVHELLHLHFASFQDGEDRDFIHKRKEQVINLLTNALLQLERKSENKK